MLRGFIGLIINLIWINKRWRHVLFESITPGLRMKLIYRVSGSIVSVSLGFVAVKYFPLTYSTSMRNISPFFALIFSAIFAREPPTCG